TQHLCQENGEVPSAILTRACFEKERTSPARTPASRPTRLRGSARRAAHPPGSLFFAKQGRRTGNLHTRRLANQEKSRSRRASREVRTRLHDGSRMGSSRPGSEVGKHWISRVPAQNGFSGFAWHSDC